MPSTKRVDVKKECGSERLKGGKEEAGVRRGQTGVCMMPSPLTAGDLGHVLTRKYRLLIVLVDRHLACVRKC